MFLLVRAGGSLLGWWQDKKVGGEGEIKIWYGRRESETRLKVIYATCYCRLNVFLAWCFKSKKLKYKKSLKNMRPGIKISKLEKSFDAFCCNWNFFTTSVCWNIVIFLIRQSLWIFWLKTISLLVLPFSSVVFKNNNIYTSFVNLFLTLSCPFEFLPVEHSSCYSF